MKKASKTKESKAKEKKVVNIDDIPSEWLERIQREMEQEEKRKETKKRRKLQARALLAMVRDGNARIVKKKVLGSKERLMVEIL